MPLLSLKSNGKKRKRKGERELIEMNGVKIVEKMERCEWKGVLMCESKGEKWLRSWVGER